MSKKVQRLFEQFQPEHYALELRPDREKMTFTGSVIIRGQKTGRPSQRLTLHQNGLTITSARVMRLDKKGAHEITLKRTHHHSSFDQIRLHAKDRIYPGHYQIELEFKGEITRPMNGMYPCYFKTTEPHPASQAAHVDEAQGDSESRSEPYQAYGERGSEQSTQRSAASTGRGPGSARSQDGAVREAVLIATQFESHHAREVFPCIDEPEAKATFDLTLITPVGETVISNTPIKKSSVISRQSSVKSEQTTEDRQQKTIFETTPKMSTYLLAFVYGEMEHKEAKTKDGVLVRTYATPDNVKLTDFALDVAVKTLEFYNDYFGIDYPLPKCDFIALPDFASGAMENWGCITFREQCMLVDPANSSLPHKQYVAMVVAHELAHQWFGNLVTMRWWTDLWLNEGFASWIEYLAVDHLFPEWNMWTQFVVDEQQTAMKLDALEHTHPIEVEVRHPDEIRTIFDTISYAKGSSVIHMLHDYLGADMFREGLRYYLKQHEYGNTDTVDLWAALETASHKPVKEFMHQWTSRGGYPIVNAEIDEKKATLAQERFYINPAARDRQPSDQLWPVPLLSGAPTLPTILPAVSADFPLEGNETLKLNRGQSGFYRTIYNATHQQRLSDLIRRGKLEPMDRLGVLSDSFEAAKAGYTDTTEPLAMLESFKQEDNAVVWDIIAGNLGSIRMAMDDEGLREMMKPYVRQLASIQLERLGWESKDSEPYFDKLLRPTILGMASWAEEPAVVKEALHRFKTMKQPEDIHPDLRSVVYGTAVRHGTEAELKKLLDLHNTTTLSEERTLIAAAVTGFKQPKLIDIVLEQIDSPTVRLQDVGYWVAYSFMNRYAREKTWDWMVEHWDWLEKNIGTDMSFSRFPIYSARAFSDADFLPVFKGFFEPRMSPALERSINQGIEIIEWQSAWKSRDLPLVKAFFSKPA